jgi:hypothetical protein
MNTEHIVAVVIPTAEGESTLDAAQDTVSRGGRASVVVLLTKETIGDIRKFAEVEELTFPDAREIFIERLTDSYATRVGIGESSVVTLDIYSGRSVIENAQTHATTIAMPQKVANRRGWRSSIARSRVPVLISPTRAA